MRSQNEINMKLLVVLAHKYLLQKNIFHSKHYYYTTHVLIHTVPM